MQHGCLVRLRVGDDFRQLVLGLVERALLRPQRRLGGLEDRLDAVDLFLGERQAFLKALYLPPLETLRGGRLRHGDNQRQD